MSQPVRGKGNGLAPSEALKRRVELVRLIERAERDWLVSEGAIERQIQLVRSSGEGTMTTEMPVDGTASTGLPEDHAPAQLSNGVQSGPRVGVQ